MYIYIYTHVYIYIHTYLRDLERLCANKAKRWTTKSDFSFCCKYPKNAQGRPWSGGVTHVIAHLHCLRYVHPENQGIRGAPK